MKWKYTNVHHPIRIAMGLTVTDYCILDIIYKSQTHPNYTRSGWANTSYRKIGGFLGISPATVKNASDKMVKREFLEIDPDKPQLKKTTSKWYEYAYLEDPGPDILESVQKLNVQKLNGKRSDIEHQRSDSEQKRSDIEHISIIKETKPKKKTNTTESIFLKDAVYLIDILNEYAGRQFPNDPDGKGPLNGTANIKLILALFKKKYTKEDIERMIIYKCWKWKSNLKMAEFLRPKTLFGVKNAPHYIQEAFEAETNPRFKSVLLAAQQKETGQVKLGQDSADLLQNW